VLRYLAVVLDRVGEQADLLPEFDSLSFRYRAPRESLYIQLESNDLRFDSALIYEVGENLPCRDLQICSDLHHVVHCGVHPAGIGRHVVFDHYDDVRHRFGVGSRYRVIRPRLFENRIGEALYLVRCSRQDVVFCDGVVRMMSCSMTLWCDSS